MHGASHSIGAMSILTRCELSGLLGKCLQQADVNQFPDYLFWQWFVDWEMERTD